MQHSRHSHSPCHRHLKLTLDNVYLTSLQLLLTLGGRPIAAASPPLSILRPATPSDVSKPISKENSNDWDRCRPSGSTRVATSRATLRTRKTLGGGSRPAPGEAMQALNQLHSKPPHKDTGPKPEEGDTLLMRWRPGRMPMPHRHPGHLSSRRT